MHTIDLHVHTAESSPCGVVPAAKMALHYKQKGFSGIVITDHYRKNLFTCAEDEENIQRFLAGYRNAKQAGDACGLRVYLGMELKLNEHPDNEYLLYGIDEAFLHRFPRIFALPLPKVHQIVRDYGAVLIQAHPFRNLNCTPRSILDVDGYEVFNGHFCHLNFNEHALWLAEARHALMTAGSDAHTLYDIGNGGVYEPDLPAPGALADFIKTKPARLQTRKQALKVAVLTSDAPAAMQALSTLSGLDAVLTFAAGNIQPPAGVPVFCADTPFYTYLPDRRYTLFSGNAKDTHPLEPSLYMCTGKTQPPSFASCTLARDSRFSVSRSGSQFQITIADKSLTVLSFRGFRPSLVYEEIYHD